MAGQVSVPPGLKVAAEWTRLLDELILNIANPRNAERLRMIQVRLSSLLISFLQYFEIQKNSKCSSHSFTDVAHF
jgi:hypothetical protein